MEPMGSTRRGHSADDPHPRGAAGHHHTNPIERYTADSIDDSVTERYQPSSVFGPFSTTECACRGSGWAGSDSAS